jgi:hypothetical protein
MLICTMNIPIMSLSTWDGNTYIAEKFGGELNLAVWRIDQLTAKLKSASIKLFLDFARTKAIAHRESTWWVWSLGSSNNSWTTCRSLESLLLRTRLVFDFSFSLLPMIGVQIFLNKLCPRTQRRKQYSCSPGPVDVISSAHAQASSGRG